MAKSIYSTHFSTKTTPQSEPIPGTSQTKNNAGGFAWQVDKWNQLMRFLILGTQGGTYYVSEKKLTVDNASAVVECIRENGAEVVRRVVEVSEAGRAAKNDPALFVLALCAAAPDEATRKLALSSLEKVARTGTHLFTFLEMVQEFRGWGRAFSRAVGNWYSNKRLNDLAYQLIKYRQRNGWTHRDVLRLTHLVPDSDERNAVYRWVVKDEDSELLRRSDLINGFLKIQQAQSAKEAANLVTDYKLPREAVPTEFLKSKEVWAALLPLMPLTALIRNLGNMGSAGLLKEGAFDVINTVVEKITDADYLHKSRVHPVAVLIASETYYQGHGTLGSNSWPVVPQIVDALGKAFYASFANVEPTGKRFLLGVDVSGSMSNPLMGIRSISCAKAAAVLAMVTARTEQKYIIKGFTHNFVDLPITANTGLSEAMRITNGLNFGGTDCALPMQYALKHGIEVDMFCVYTDSETWYGQQHPVQALREYRQKTGIPAKLAVVAMESNDVTIADPNDAGMLDLVGFDSSLPTALAEFAKM